MCNVFRFCSLFLALSLHSWPSEQNLFLFLSIFARLKRETSGTTFLERSKTILSIFYLKIFLKNIFFIFNINISK